MVRTTVDLDDDLLDTARAIARATGRSLGRVLSDLARRGLAPQRPFVDDDLLPTFDVSARARPITNELVADALEDE